MKEQGINGMALSVAFIYLVAHLLSATYLSLCGQKLVNGDKFSKEL